MNKHCLKEWINHAGQDFAAGSSSRTGSGERPSVQVQTANTYDDDESFTMVSLNLLSKHEYLSLTPNDAINSTLVFPADRSMYLEAIQQRKSHACHLSPRQASMLESVFTIFGAELKKIVERETLVANPYQGGKFNLSTKRPGSPSREKNRRSFCFGESALFGGCKVKKLDWKLTEAIEQVQSLRLDGAPSPSSNISGGSYTPPTQLGRIPL